MNAIPVNQAIAAQVREVVAACLHVVPGEIEDDAPLTRYGLDPLNAVELAVALSDMSGRRLAAETLLDRASVAAVAAYVTAPADPARYPPVRRMLADCMLPADIDPRAAAESGPGPLLLTGATGFLGAHLVASLLESTPHEIVCLVRAGSDREARIRLAEAAGRYGIAADWPERVRVIAGDVERERLGLELPAYAALSARIATVLHCAAAMDWSGSYAALAGPNVSGTIELLRFASSVRRKAFHFVSSISACYSTCGPDSIRESDTDPADPSGIHLGYAQTKWVGEALVRQAAGRGLDTAIYRPGLIAGHSETGVSNHDDFLARLVKGCIDLGAAPDIAWPVDACPVDFAARALARLTLAEKPGGAVAHLVNPRVVYWPEAVLWMRLRGYRVQLVPYGDWIALVQERARDPRHPLHALRGFLLRQPPGEDGRFLPELYAHPLVPRVDARVTRLQLSNLGIDCPPLDPQLLHTWFDGYVRSGFLPAASVRAAAARGVDLVPQLEALLQRHHGDPGLAIQASRRFTVGEGNSILGELASGHAGSALVLQGYSLEFATSAGRRSRLDVVVKPRPHDDAVMQVACAVAGLCNERLGEALARHWTRTVFSGTGLREIALHDCGEPAINACAPRAFGVLECARQRALVLEHVKDVALNDAEHAHERWGRADVETALAGIARVHAAYYGREPELVVRHWLGPVLTAAAVRDSHELWMELSGHARSRIAEWAGDGAGHLLQRLALAAPERARFSESLHRGLVHHDFNPRNVGVRVRHGRAELCAFDWELATLALPQRDLAELLCFVLPPNAPAGLVSHYVEFHRARIEHEIGTAIDPHDWCEGFRFGLADFGVERLALYVTAHRLRPLPYLERVAQSWAHLMTLAGTQTITRGVVNRAA